LIDLKRRPDPVPDVTAALQSSAYWVGSAR